LKIDTVKYYILFYKTVENYLELRVRFRSEHLTLAHKFKNEGHLKLAGALANPADGAVLVFMANGPEIAEEFAKNDPYVKNGLISDWQVREWTVVIGDE
jgi:hypothetical protein